MPSDRQWPAWAGLALSVVGLAVSIYLTIEHYTGNRTLACAENGLVSCSKVTTSSSSVVLGLPVAIYGIVFFVAAIGLFSPPAWRSRRTSVHQVRLAAVGVGMLSVLYLVYVELLVVDAICLWCTVVHVITFLLLLLTLAFRSPSLTQIRSSG